MNSAIDSAFGRFLAGWIGGVQRRAAWILLAAVVTTTAVFAYTVETLGINTKTEDMISQELPFRRATKEYKRAFPKLVSTLIVVVEGDTPDVAVDAAAALAQRLQQEDELFETVYRPGGDEFFVKYGLLYLSVDELGDLADNLAEVQPLLAALAEDSSLRGLFSELEKAVAEIRDGNNPAFDLEKAFDRLSDALEAALEERPYHLSWREVISGQTATAADRRRLIVVQPRLDFNRLQPASVAIKAVRRLADELALVPANGVRVRTTGSIALNYDQLKSAREGATTAGALSFVLVGLVLFAGLRSVRLVAAALGTLIIGLIWTAGFAAAAIGELNLISVAFAVLFIGLGVAFSIHMCLRYRELVHAGHPEALVTAGREIGKALFLCATTTAAGFYVFVPTDYTGVSDLGLISGTGMLISLVANLTILPAMLTLMPLRAGSRVDSGTGQGVGRALVEMLGRRRRVVRFAAVAATLGALALLPRLWFDFNPLNLHDPRAESVTTLRDLLADGGGSAWPLRALAPSLDEAEALAARLDALDVVDKVVTIADYVPKRQAEKLALIEEIGFFMGLPSGRVLPPPDDDERLAAIRAFASALDAWTAEGVSEPSLAASVGRLAAGLDRFATPAAGTARASLEALENSLLGTLPERLRRLYAALEVAEPITLADLPRALLEREVSADGRVRVQAFPQGDLSDNTDMRRFVDAVRGIAPDAVGFPVSVLESGDAVVRAFRQALASAVVAIVVLLVLLMRRLTDTLLVLAPLLLAAVLTGAASVVLDIPFNFANIIVLPLLLGVGVDSAIHLVHRHRTDPAARAGLLHTSTARAVVFSALTTICSFGSLTISSHRGMATMGELLTIGVGLMLVCTLVVLPALLSQPPSPTDAGAKES